MNKKIGLLDCNNFYVSCERVFRPDLKGKPVVVLNNNDWCAIARSNEAKDLGIKMGEPYFKFKDIAQKFDVKIFSSNFALYGDISNRVMKLLQAMVPHVEVYSIDEAFLDLTLISDKEVEDFCLTIREEILRCTGIPTSIGISHTKTLAKVANHYSKKSRGVLALLNQKEIDSFLARFPITDVWGIGYNYAKYLLSHNIDTALKLKHSPPKWIRQKMGVVGERIVTELNGQIAYVTNADSPWVSRIDLGKFELLQPDILIHQTMTAQGGPNGMTLSGYFPPASIGTSKIGTCLPLTGKYATEARECRLGLQFWEQMVNAAGGIIWQGKRHHIKIIYEDTESSTDDEVLTKKAEALLKNNEATPGSKDNGIVAVLGTFPPIANKSIAKALKANEISFITSTGREPKLFEENPRHVFGISPVKHEADLISTLRALFHGNNLTSKPHKILILACNDLDSISEAEGLVKYAQDNEIKILSPLNDKDSWIEYRPDTAEIDKLLQELSEKAHEQVKYCPDVTFVIGHRQESLDIFKACRKYNFSPGAIALNTGIINPAFMTQLGSLADNLLGSVCWWDSCNDFAYDRFVSSTDFQRNFYSVYGQNPSDLVAGFAASGIVFEEALRQGEILRTQGCHKKLNDLVANLDFTTFYGPIKFNTSGQNEKKKIATVRLERVGSTLKATSLWPK